MSLHAGGLRRLQALLLLIGFLGAQPTVLCGLACLGNQPQRESAHQGHHHSGQSPRLCHSGTVSDATASPVAMTFMPMVPATLPAATPDNRTTSEPALPPALLSPQTTTLLATPPPRNS